MCKLVFMVIFVIFIERAASAAVTRTDEDLSDQETKIAQLKNLLKEYAKVSNNDEAPPPVDSKKPDIELESAKESKMEEEDGEHLQKLPANEVKMLQKLKEDLQKEMDDRKNGFQNFMDSLKKEKEPTQIGKFLQSPVQDVHVSTRGNESLRRLKQLASFISKRTENQEGDHGTFGKILNRNEEQREDLRINDLELHVDRLLEDVDILLRKGFSLKEVMDNISARAEKEKKVNEEMLLERRLKEILQDKMRGK